MKRFLAWSAILFVIGVGLLFFGRNTEKDAISLRKEVVSDRLAQPSPTVTSSQESDAGSSRTFGAESDETKSNEKQKKRIVDLSPTIEEYRRDVARDPHGLPRSYLIFAQELAEKFDAAVANPSRGPEFLDELVECAKSPELRKIIAVPTVCLANIRRYGEKVPSFRNETDAIYRNADSVLKK